MSSKLHLQKIISSCHAAKGLTIDGSFIVTLFSEQMYEILKTL